MKLFMIPECPFVHRVLLTCHVRGFAPNLIQKSNVNLQSPPAEMLKINPSGSVPTLQFEDHGGFHESLVIMEYLDTLEAPGRKIWGTSPRQIAETKVMWETANNKLLAPIQQCIYSFGNMNTLRTAFERLDLAWNWLGEQLSNSKSAYLGGHEPNAVDIAIAPFLVRLRFVAERQPHIPLPARNSCQGEYLARIDNFCSQSGVFPEEAVMRQTTLKFALPHPMFVDVQSAPRTLIDDPRAVVAAAGAKLSSWTVEKDAHGFCLKGTFHFETHSDAVNKLKWLHDAQEICDHHTSFMLKDFTDLEVTLVTHEPRWGITQKDLTMAQLLQTYFTQGCLPQ